jgi:eukaryotic-like serine/threonine-protein kinase
MFDGMAPPIYPVKGINVVQRHLCFFRDFQTELDMDPIDKSDPSQTKEILTDDLLPSAGPTPQIVEECLTPPIRPALTGTEVTHTFEGSDVGADLSVSGDLVLGSGDFEREKTVISQKPVPSPSDLYRSLPLNRLAEMLEGRQLDHFQVEQIIGGGGMGAVFRGVDQRLGRVVAIKVIPGTKRDEQTLRRFQQEAQAAARLDHPNIARVYFVGESETWNYIVFEYIEGVNLRDLVVQQGPLSIDEAVFYTRQIAEALQHAHERDVVHRDIKPSNILITPQGMAKLVDMGLARDTSIDKSTADQTASGVTLGTFDYISPEQARDPREADVRSDLYSLGCTLFYTLTGHPPFPEGTALQKLLNHGSLPPPDPRGWRDDISDELYDIMMRLMAKRPSDRYQRPIELVNDLLILAEQENLPRSQGPSTITLGPSISQPTLLETHLPWLLASLVLLASTLWLHSQMTLSTGFAFPSANYPIQDKANLERLPLPTSTSSGNLNSSTISPKETSAVENSVSAPGNNNVQTNPAVVIDNPNAASDATPTGTSGIASDLNTPPPISAVSPAALGSAGPTRVLPPTPSSVIVVSASRPEEIGLDAWESSLARAVQRASSTSGAVEIEVRGIAALDRPVEISANSDVTIRGFNETSRIEVTRSAWNIAMVDKAVITVVDASLTLRSIQMRATITDGTATRNLIQVIGNSAMRCDAVDIAIMAERFNSMNLISAGDSGATTTRSAADSRVARVTIENSFIHGGTSVFKVNHPQLNNHDSVQIGINNSLLAVTGRIVDFISATGEGGVERIFRLFCDRSTFVANEGFAQLSYVGAGQPATGFNRNSQSCVYWSSTGAPHLKLIGNNADPGQNPDQLSFHGVDNAYDLNTSELCVIGQEQYSMLAGQQAGWYTERSTERIIRWKSTATLNSNYWDAKPGDFQLMTAHFVPGYRTSIVNTPQF